MRKTILSLVLAGTAFLPVYAQQQPQQADDDGYAPEHGVARISVLNGDVSVRRGDSGELSTAALNGPLVTEDHLATGPSGRAEVQFDWGNLIRLGPETEVRMGDLQDRHYLVQIATGTTTFRVLRNSGADVEISTPTVSVRPAEEGSYRVTVFPDGTTEITVRVGRAEVFSPRGTETLTPGRTMQARGDANDPEYMIIAAIPQDEWDRWNVDRDRVLEQTSSYRYVSPDVTGAEDLDQYGRWTNDPQYGNVWVPTVDTGWAPYRDGRWVDEPYYGWTWVSADPWGWAPYHYGNWYMSSYGWAWYPGALGGRHYWRPALVGFFGWGSGGFGGGFGFGNVGWVPLAPYERFHPWYGRGGFNNTRITNITVVNNFRNARSFNGRGNGVTSINAGDFGRGRSINRNNFVRASNNDLARAGQVQGRLPFTGSVDGRRMSDRPVNTQSLPRVNTNTRFSQRGSPSSNQPGGQPSVQSRPAQPFNGSRNFGGGGTSGGTNGGTAAAPQVNRGNSNPIGNTGGNTSGNTGGNWRRMDGNGSNSPQIIRGGRNNNNNNNERTRTVQPTPQGNPQQGQFRQAAPQQQPPPQVQQQQQQQRQYVPRQSSPQPVRINPPMIRERAPSPAPAPQVSRPEQPRGGGFGQPRPQGNGGGGGGQQQGGGNRGGGGGGGNRGGGGGHDRR